MVPNSLAILWASKRKARNPIANGPRLRCLGGLLATHKHVDLASSPCLTDVFVVAKMTRQQVLDSIKRDYDETYFFTGDLLSKFLSVCTTKLQHNSVSLLMFIPALSPDLN